MPYLSENDGSLPEVLMLDQSVLQQDLQTGALDCKLWLLCLSDGAGCLQSSWTNLWLLRSAIFGCIVPLEFEFRVVDQFLNSAVFRTTTPCVLLLSDQTALN